MTSAVDGAHLALSEAWLGWARGGGGGGHMLTAQTIFYSVRKGVRHCSQLKAHATQPYHSTVVSNNPDVMSHFMGGGRFAACDKDRLKRLHHTRCGPGLFKETHNLL